VSSTQMDRRAFLGLGVGILGVAVAPRWVRGSGIVHRSTVPVMGTLAELAVVDTDPGRAGLALRAAAVELTRIEALMTRFDASSDVGRYNAAVPGERVAVSPETVEVVLGARRWAGDTAGAFDPTLERLTRIWDPAVTNRPPLDDARLTATNDAGAWSELDGGTDGADGWLVRRRGTALDLGGIAKGWAIDRSVDLLAGMGVTAALVNVGGDLAALGSPPDGEAWRIGIRDPRDPDGVVRTVDLADGAMATSGDYLRFFRHDGVRYAHILDPVRSAPRRGGTSSITVTARRAVDADAAATAAFILGRAAAQDRFAKAGRDARIIHTA